MGPGYIPNAARLGILRLGLNYGAANEGGGVYSDPSVKLPTSLSSEPFPQPLRQQSSGFLSERIISRSVPPLNGKPCGTPSG